MAIKRYIAEADNTITNAFEANLITRATKANMGAADVLETFVIHGQTSASISAESAEEARIIIQFPVSGTNAAIETIHRDRSNNVLPPQGKVSFYLRMFNARHAESTPEDFDLDVKILSKTWNEGRGLDMDTYSDTGFSSWLSSSSGSAWSSPGGDFHSAVDTDNFSASVNFKHGFEDIEVDVTTAVENWIDGTKANYGFLLKHIPSSLSGNNGTLYTKKFFARTTEFFFRRPVIEARWDDSRKDHRGSFFISSSLLDQTDNINRLYLYNRFRGQLKNIPGLKNNKLKVGVYSNVSESAQTVVSSSGASVTAIEASRLFENGIHVTGVYTCSFASTLTASILHDVWFTGSTTFHTGSFRPKNPQAQEFDESNTYLNNIRNLKSSYRPKDKPRLRIFARPKDWSPTIYSVASKKIETSLIEDAYYKVVRITDDVEAIPYGTGSDNQTRTSYDVSGNYFDLDMSLLEPGFSYGIRLTYYLLGQYQEQPEIFKFRVDE